MYLRVDFIKYMDYCLLFAERIIGRSLSLNLTYALLFIGYFTINYSVLWWQIH